MSDNVIQHSFAAGELAPSLLARTDLQKYHSGAAVMRNFFVDYRSGTTTRMGTELVWQSISVTRPRLIGFQYSSNLGYTLEFGNDGSNNYIRFIQNGGYVLETANAITGVSNANPCVITAANSYVPGDVVFVLGVGGMTALNGQYYLVIGSTGTTVTLQRTNGLSVNSISYSTYTSGGTIARVYTIPSPYAPADLALLRFAQYQNVMTLVHSAYAPRTLTLVSTVPIAWTLLTIVFGGTINPPTGVAGVASGAGTTNYSFVVTSVDANGQESVASAAAAVNSAVNIGSTAGSITVTWVAAANAVAYNIYKAEVSFAGVVPFGAAYGFIGSATGLTFIDSNIVPDFTSSPPNNQNPFAGNNPSVTCFFQQRQVYAASNANLQTFWMSVPGTYTNFNQSSPVQPDDAITGTLVSTQVNAIEWMLPMPGGLVTGTSKGAWQIGGGPSSIQAGQTPITPANAQAVPQAYNGAAPIQPIVYNYDILYVQAKSSIVRDLSYNIYAGIYTGNDISVLSNHMFFGHQIQEWAFAEEPFKMVWAVREDGIALSLAFIKEQEIYGWSRHDTNGYYVSVASITEGQVDAVYWAVQRTLAGGTFYFIERVVNTPIYAFGAEDSWQVDCGIQSPLSFPAANLSITGLAQGSTGTGQVTASAGVFSSGSVGSVLRCGGGIATITAFTSNISVTASFARPITTLPPGLTGPLTFASGAWSLTAPSTVFSGLDPFEGQKVSILADGGVVAPQVVTNGTITLQNPASKVTVGLGFQAQLQTMYLDIGEPTIQGKRKKIGALTVRNANSRGLKAGRTFSTLVPIKELNPATILGQPINLITGDTRVVMDPLWDVPGQICLQQDDPLPATVLGVIPEIVVGDTSK